MEEPMLISERFFVWAALGATVALTVFVAVAHANVPRGWILVGTKAANYEVLQDVEQSYQGHLSVALKSKQSKVDGFGTLMQSIQAEQYRGKKIRFGGMVKSDEVVDWAGLWMRIDRGKDVVAFDNNMQNRAIKGTAAWQRYEVVLDVPKDATSISFGVLLTGGGEVWLNSAKFDIVGDDAPVTGWGESPVPNASVNLEFTE
jgi:hypothetical protein